MTRVAFTLAIVTLTTLFACAGQADVRNPAPPQPSVVTIPLADPASESAARVPSVDPASESLGGLELGTDGAEVEALLGAPTSKSEVVEYAATGDRLSIWVWEEKGVMLAMSELSGRFLVAAMAIEAPSSLTTSRGVGIGTPHAEVDRIYAPFRGKGGVDDEPLVWSAEQILVGSVYGGTSFRFEDGKVRRIFIGAAAE